MNPRSPLAVPSVQWPSGAGIAPAPVSRAPSPLAQRLAEALRSRVMSSRGRLDRLELALLHTLPAGAGWSTGWRLRAAIEGVTRARAQSDASPVLSLRTIDRGTLAPGSALDELWQWAVDTSAAYRLPPPALREQVQFDDRATAPSMEVLRHRVLRSAAVLERLPLSVTVTSSRRKPDDDPATIEEAGAMPPPSADAPAGPDTPEGARPVAAGAGTIAVIRLIARFPEREGTRGDTRVVLWSADRTPEVGRLLRQCARQLDPRATIAARPVQAQP